MQAKSLNLKITGLKTFVVNSGSLNWVFCKVYTNADLIGLGEGSVTSKEATVAQAIMEHERFLLDKDPTDIELLWQGMFRNPRWRGGPVLNSAISAAEIAFWELLARRWASLFTSCWAVRPERRCNYPERRRFQESTLEEMPGFKAFWRDRTGNQERLRRTANSSGSGRYCKRKGGGRASVQAHESSGVPIR